MENRGHKHRINNFHFVSLTLVVNALGFYVGIDLVEATNSHFMISLCDCNLKWSWVSLFSLPVHSDSQRFSLVIFPHYTKKNSEHSFY